MINHYEYYKYPAVRERIAEYCGGTANNPSNFSSEYIVGYGEELLRSQKKDFLSIDTKYFHDILDKGLDIFRSIWDKCGTVCVLDIEYFNLDYAGEVYYNPERTFKKIEPLYNLIKSLYQKYNIPYLCIMTGQGYHFSSFVSTDSALSKKLENIGYIEETVAKKYREMTRRRRKVSIAYGKIFNAIGRLMEFLTHQILAEGNKISPVPIVFSDIPVGKRGEIGREAISIDLTAFADPVYMRDIRCPFSTHQKHRLQKYKVGEYIAEKIPIQIALPRDNKISLDELLFARRHFRRSSEIAENANCQIPKAEQGFENLFNDYLKSKLYEFHRNFDSVQHDTPELWQYTYDKLDESNFPECIKKILHYPNPNALMPGNIQTLVRFLLKNHWHPKHIAGLLRSKYERSHYFWDTDWNKYDPSSRANFWCRCFAGFIYCNIDGEIDYNCVSHQEKGLCPNLKCGHYL